MSRSNFNLLLNVPIQDILLDTRNPRIRDGSDQADCIARILRKEDQLKVLMKDIAENGLTTMPIIVKPQNDKWIVKDGNRRITSLKLLNDPNLCPIEGLKPYIESLRDKHKENIIKAVDVLASSKDDLIAREILARHSGEKEGAGQVNWNAYMRTVFQINNDHPVDYKRAGQYALWAEKNNIIVDDDFPITSLQRFFTIENLDKLGFKIENDNLIPGLPDHLVKTMTQIVMNDFRGDIKVGDIRTTDKAGEYISSVRARVGLFDNPAPLSPTPPIHNPAPPAPNPAPKNPAPPSPVPPAPSPPPTPPAPTPAPTPIKPSYERSKLFGARAPINLPIPATEVKALNIVSELRKLDVKAFPIGTAMLLRALIELSDDFYRSKNSIILPNKEGLGKKIIKSSEHMAESGLININELDIIKRLCSHQNEITLLHIESLQKIIHKDSHNPDYQLVNTLWDNFGVFVRACWRN